MGKSAILKIGTYGVAVAAPLIASVLLAGSATSVAAATWRTVANSATPIPGASGKVFSSFNQPSINEGCKVVFRARGKGPGQPPRGVYLDDPCKTAFRLRAIGSVGDVVPDPNNTGAVFNEFPAIPRIEYNRDFVATRGQTRPVWEYTLPDGSDTRVGTAGVFVARGPDFAIKTGVNQLGAVPAFTRFAVPGYPGVKFDQFPGAPSPFDARFVAFKGNFTDGATPRTGVFFRDVISSAAVVRIADTKTPIPNGTTTFGSTAPPSGAKNMVVFVGSDNEDAPTQGGIYAASRFAPTTLRTLVGIGDRVPGVAGATFNRFGEGLSYDGNSLGFWGAWGDATRTVTLRCPVDGNADVVAACKTQCPTVDAEGFNVCTRTEPVNQGIFALSGGRVRLIARAGAGQRYASFLYWVFSGRPPGVGGGDEVDEAEPPRWRSSAFVATTRQSGGGAAAAFKARATDGSEGVFVSAPLATTPFPAVLTGSPASAIDPAAPKGSLVSTVSLERDGFRNCRLAVAAGFLQPDTLETWAGVYVNLRGCRR